jgi:hypothetical protein
MTVAGTHIPAANPRTAPPLLAVCDCCHAPARLVPVGSSIVAEDGPPIVAVEPGAITYRCPACRWCADVPAEGRAPENDGGEA